MFEYKADFLMSPHADPQADFGFCQASSAAEDQLSALADLVGTGQTLHPTSRTRGEPLARSQSELTQSVSEPAIQMVEDAPALEFDLEHELAQAFEQQMGVQSTPVAEAAAQPITEPVAAAAAAIDLENFEQDVPSPATAFDKVLLRDTGPAEAVAPVLPELDYPQVAMPAPAAEPAVQLPEPDLEIDLDGALEAALDAELSMELERALEEEVIPVAAPAPGAVPSGSAGVDSADMASILAAMPKAEAPRNIAPTVANVFGGLNSVEQPAPEPASPSVQPMDDFRRELSRLMGASAASPEAEPAQAQNAPVQQAPAAAPASVAEIVSAPEIPAAPVEPAPLTLPEFDPVAMRDFTAQPASASPELNDYLASQPASASAAAISVESLNQHGAAEPVATAQPDVVAQNDYVAHDPIFDDPAFSDPAADIAPENAGDTVAEADNDNRRRKGVMAAAVVGAIALFGGAAAIGLSSFGGDGPAPEILASSEPVKVKPAQAGGQVVPNQDQAVFQSEADKPADQAALKESAEKPITVALNNGGAKNEDRITTGDTGTVVQSRRVRTVVVRPDGTIVSNSADPAPAATAPQVQQPTLTLQPTAPKAAPAEAEAPRTVTYSAPRGDDSTLAPKPQQVAKLETKPVKVETVKVKPKPAPAPKPEAKKPAPKPEAPKQTASDLPSVSSPYAVQIASQRSADAAKRSYSNLSRRYASVLRGKGVDIRKAVIDGKGTYYRVRIPAQSRGEANTLCRRLKANGGSCFVTR